MLTEDTSKKGYGRFKFFKLSGDCETLAQELYEIDQNNNKATADQLKDFATKLGLFHGFVTYSAESGGLHPYKHCVRIRMIENKNEEQSFYLISPVDDERNQYFNPEDSTEINDPDFIKALSAENTWHYEHSHRDGRYQMENLPPSPL